MLSTLRRRTEKLEGRAVKSCPACADWPNEIHVRIVEEIIEPGEPIPPRDPDERHPAEFGPCSECGRTHRAKVIALEEAEPCEP